jgi:hypothetical protein
MSTWAGVTGDLRPYRLRGSFVSLLLWEGHSLTYVAEQAGHSIATLARHYAGTMRELETKPSRPCRGGHPAGPRGSLGDALRTHSWKFEYRKWTNPLQILSGRCWARTSDLRLVEAALSQLS